MCGFVRPSEPLIDTLNTTCRNRYAKYNELGEDEEDTETEENASDSSSGAIEPVDMPAAGKHVVLLLDRADPNEILGVCSATVINYCVNFTELQILLDRIAVLRT